MICRNEKKQDDYYFCLVSLRGINQEKWPISIFGYIQIVVTSFKKKKKDQNLVSSRKDKNLLSGGAKISFIVLEKKNYFFFILRKLACFS